MTETRNLTAARNLAPTQLVDFDQLPDACLVYWGSTGTDSIACGTHRVVHVALTAAGRRTFVHLDNGRRVEIRSDRKLVVLDRDLPSDTEAAALAVVTPALEAAAAETDKAVRAYRRRVARDTTAGPKPAATLYTATFHGLRFHRVTGRDVTHAVFVLGVEIENGDGDVVGADETALPVAPGVWRWVDSAERAHMKAAALGAQGYVVEVVEVTAEPIR